MLRFFAPFTAVLCLVGVAAPAAAVAPAAIITSVDGRSPGWVLGQDATPEIVVSQVHDGDIVELRVNGTTRATRTAGASSSTMTFNSGEAADVTLADDGEYTLSVFATAATGEQVLNGGGSYLLDRTPPATPTVWEVAGDRESPAELDDASPAVLLSNVGSGIEMILSVDGVEVATTSQVSPPALGSDYPVTASFNWDEVEFEVTPGEHTITAVSVDAAGNTSGTSAGFTYVYNPDPPNISLSDVVVTEDDGGTPWAYITLTLDKPSSRWLYVEFGMSYGTASSDDVDLPIDYLLFEPGDLTRWIPVRVYGDYAHEPPESAVVSVIAGDVDIADGTSTITIHDNDQPHKPQPGHGYVLVDAAGAVYTFGVTHRGGLSHRPLSAPIIGITLTPSGKGYWLVGRDGGIFTFGDAKFFGSAGDRKLNAPILGMEATPSGGGYWLFAADGGIFTFGDAKFFGSTGDRKLNAPMIGMEATDDGLGYWLVAQDGGIFTFGSAPFYGSTGAMKLNQPVFDMTSAADGSGYWLIARDGGVFTFSASFHGAAVGRTGGTVVGMNRTPSGGGYWVADAAGRVLPFGDAGALGDLSTNTPPRPIVGFAARR